MNKYTIKKGTKNSIGRACLPSYKKKDLKFTFLLDENCLYKNYSCDNKNSINTVYGISWGNIDKESFNIGWNCDYEAKTIGIYLCWYNNWKYTSLKLQNIEVNQEVEFSIKFWRNIHNIDVRWRVNGHTQYSSIPFNFNKVLNWGFKNYPNLYSPYNFSDIDIYIKEDDTRSRVNNFNKSSLLNFHSIKTNIIFV